MSGIIGRRKTGRYSERMVQALLEPLEERLFLASHPWTLLTNEVDFNSTDTGLQGICAADFNGDGKMDLAMGNESTGMTVVMGNGNETFQAPVKYATGSDPTWIIAADLNHDGKPDIVTANTGSSTISVFINKGDGTFKPGVTYTTGSGPFSVVSGDFNADGKMDLAVGNTYDQTISVFYGNGDGTFITPPTLLQTISTDCQSLVAADINHDGRPDLVIADEDGDSFSVFMNSGGGFSAGRTYQLNNVSTPEAVVVGDLNGDSNQDVGVLDSAGGTVDVWTGDTNGQFTEETNPVYSAGSNPMNGVLLDMNGDGKLDLITVNGMEGSSDDVSFIQGKGDGSFGAETDFATDYTPTNIISTDINGDGKKEVIVDGWGLAGVEIFAGGYVNTPPVAVDDYLAVTQDTVGNVLGVRTNDTDADGDALTVTTATAASHGTATVSGGGIIYIPTYGYTGSDTFSYTISDGWGGTDTATVHLTVNAISTPPVVTTTLADLAYTTSTGPKVFDTALTVTDSTIPNLELNKATVSITGNYASGEDVLAFTAQSGITGSFDSTAGVLTLSGMATMAAYQAALRSVTFNDASLSPSLLKRTLAISVNDGATSNQGWTVPAVGTGIRSIDITYGFMDLTGVFGTTWTLPGAVVAGKALTGYASVIVKNIGNIPLPTGQLVNLQVVARDTTNTNNPDITLVTLSNQSVSKLAANGSATFLPYVNRPAGLTTDNYQIFTNIIPVQTLGESDTTNDQASQTALGATETLVAAAPFVDLSAAFGTTLKLPATDTSGDGKLISVPVVVKNKGNVALPAGQKINIEIDAFDGTTTTPIKTLTAQSVSALGAGLSATFTASVTLPPGLPSGTYNLIAVADSSSLLTGDTDRTNNTVTTSGAMAVTYGYVDMTGTFGTTWTLPSAVVGGKPLLGYTSVVVHNIGDVALPTGQLANIVVLAHDTTNTNNPDITLATLSNQSVSLLAAGGTKSFSAYVNRPGGVPADNYQILANITPVGNLTEAHSDNNQASQTGAGAGKTLAAAVPFVDLSAAFGATLKLPATDISGDGKLMTVPVVVKNIGNIALPALQKINIEIEAFDGTTATLLKTLTAQSVSSLAAGGSATFTATGVTLPVGLAAGTYNLVAVVDSSSLVAGDTNRVNNTVTSSGSMAVTMGYVDLTAAFGSTLKLPAADTSGDGKLMTVPVVINNVGNVALPLSQKINIEIDAFDGTTTTPIKTLVAQSVSSLKAGGSATFTASVTLPAGLAAGTYNLVAVADSSNLVAESNEGNNTVTSAGTIAVTYGFVDLSGVFGTLWTLPSTAKAGKALTGYASVVVKNGGNVALPTGQNVNIVIVAHDTTNTNNPDVILATLANQSVSALAAGATKQFSAYISRAAGLTADTYQIQAVIAPVQPLTESDPGNNVVLLNGLGNPMDIVVS